MPTKEKVLQALSGIVHPDKGKDIVSLGMVSEVKTDGEGISMVLTPERSNDPFITSIRSTIVRILKEKLGPDTVVSEIKVEPRVVVGKQKKTEERPVLPGVMNIIAVSSG
jgi:ATP-binding protein involved in chromosome partitioning